VTRAAWLQEIPTRSLIVHDVEVRLPLAPGDVALVGEGATVSPGQPLAEHLRDPRVVIVPTQDAGARLRAGDRWAADAGVGRRRGSPMEGELLATVPGDARRWRLVTGDQRDPIPSPVAGVVASVDGGSAIRIRAFGRAIQGVLAAGSPARGRLDLATDPFGDLRPGAIDVARAGAIVVVGARIDAEALTRARAMGVRGVVTASLAGKELRDLLASERRQQAALHPAPPFAVLVLDGPLRRPIAGPILGLLESLAGREVALVTDPPALVFDAPDVRVPPVPGDWVRVRHGPNAGAEGRLLGPAGLRRFAAGVHLDAARVELDGAPVDLPIADLERLV
jgi:hypothetical protein